MNGWAWFATVLLLLLVFGFGGYTIYARLRARRLGLPPPPLLNPFARSSSSSDYAAPSPAPHNPLTWLTSKIASFRNQRTAGGAYESTTTYPSGGARGASGGGGGRRGFGPLDPDEAWDSRVENEIDRGYYEGDDVELGSTPYGGTGYGAGGSGGGVGVGVGGRGRSRSRQREVDERYDQETGRVGPGKNPFGDEAAVESLRGASPRPHEETEYRGAAGSGGQVKGKVAMHKKGQDSLEDSPTERRSMFTEDV